MPGSVIQRVAKNAERLIVYLLIIMMATVLVLATVELGRKIILAMIKPPWFVLDLGDLLDLFGVFMLVLIGIELLDTIKVYFNERVVHVEVVLLVAMIAVARKVIVMEPEEYAPMTLVGIALMVLTLAVGYYLIKRATDKHGVTEKVEGPR
jgi:uncharacterized membrane protein (DUF373 family)